MINAIFAVDQSGGIGLNGTLPWAHNADDLANFQKLTMGHVLVLGKNAWNDPKIPKPLKGRTVYVATNHPTTYALTMKGDVKTCLLALEQQHTNQIIWVGGGANVLEQCTGIFDRIYLTFIADSYKIDTRIIVKNLLNGYRPIRAIATPTSNCVLTIYENIPKSITINSGDRTTEG